MYVCPKYSESRCKDVGGNKQVPKKVITAIRILEGGQKLFGEAGRLYAYEPASALITINRGGARCLPLLID